MFLLDTESIPRTTDQLTTALNRSLRRWVQRPGAAMASVAGAVPALSSVTIDLSGGAIDADHPPDVKPATAPERGPSAARFTVVGKPVSARGVAVNFELLASDVTFDYARNAGGQLMVMLRDARDGRIGANIARRDLEAAMLQAAQAAAGPSGIAVQRVDASLATPTPRELAVDLTITAKKFVTAIVHVHGRATVDDQLDAHLSGLGAHGDGMVAKLAVGLLQGHLKKLEGQQFSLLAFRLGQVQLRDVHIRVGPDGGLALEASFGNA